MSAAKAKDMEALRMIFAEIGLSEQEISEIEEDFLKVGSTHSVDKVTIGNILHESELCFGNECQFLPFQLELLWEGSMKIGYFANTPLAEALIEKFQQKMYTGILQDICRSLPYLFEEE